MRQSTLDGGLARRLSRNPPFTRLITNQDVDTGPQLGGLSRGSPTHSLKVHAKE